MNIKNVSLAALALFLALCALFAAAFINKDRISSNDRPEPSRVNSKEAPPRDEATLSSTLIREKKLDPRYVQPIGAKAFAISRTGDFRPEGDAKSYIQSRLEASNGGDSTATFDIYLAALDCRNAGSPSELQSASRLPDPLSKQDALEASDRRLTECEELLKDPALSSPGKWLLQAAQQGSIEAMLLYTIDTESAFGGSANAVRNPEAVVEWKKNSISFLNTAANSGSVDALISLAQANNNGIITARNPTEAYAYYLAARRAMPHAMPERLLERYKEELNSSQQQNAIQRAEAIYKNCCQ